MAEQAAALAWALRLQDLAVHLGADVPDHELPIQSRIAQIQQQLAQIVASHASLRELLGQGWCTSLTTESSIHTLLSSENTEKADVDAQLAIVLDSDERMRAFLEAMEACKVLSDQEVSGAGHLASHELLHSFIHQCGQEQAEQRAQLHALEGRVHSLLKQYGDYVCVRHSHQVDQLSRIFIALDATVHQLEAAPTS